MLRTQYGRGQRGGVPVEMAGWQAKRTVAASPDRHVHLLREGSPRPCSSECRPGAPQQAAKADCACGRRTPLCRQRPCSCSCPRGCCSRTRGRGRSCSSMRTGPCAQARAERPSAGSGTSTCPPAPRRAARASARDPQHAAPSPRRNASRSSWTHDPRRPGRAGCRPSAPAVTASIPPLATSQTHCPYTRSSISAAGAQSQSRSQSQSPNQQASASQPHHHYRLTPPPSPRGPSGPPAARARRCPHSNIRPTIF